MCAPDPLFESPETPKICYFEGMSTAVLRRTPLYDSHKQLGGRLVDFHGWELPVHTRAFLRNTRRPC